MGREAIRGSAAGLLLRITHPAGSEREHRCLVQRDTHEDHIRDTFRGPVNLGALKGSRRASGIEEPSAPTSSAQCRQ